MKKFIAGLICGVMVMSTTFVFAEQIEAIFGQVKLVVDGQPIDKETLLYNGTTYVPLRAVGEALEEDVNYDDITKTAYIGEMPANINIEPAKSIETPLNMKYGYYNNEKFPGVPDMATIDQFKNQNLYYVNNYNSEDGFVFEYIVDGNTAMTEYGKVLEEVGFSKVSSDEDKSIYENGGTKVTLLNEGVHFKIIIKTNQLAEEYQYDLSTMNTSEDIEKYLHEFYSTIDTGIGTSSMSFKVIYGAPTDTEPGTCYVRAYPSKELSVWLTSDDYTDEQKNLIKSNYRSHMEILANDLISQLPNTKFTGGYCYDDGYEYDALELNYQSSQFGSWVNFDGDEIGAFRWAENLDNGLYKDLLD